MTHTDPLALPPEHDPGPGWGQSLSTGAAGLALLHIAYARVGLAGWDTRPSVGRRDDVLSYLVRLVEPVIIDDQNLPGWWTGNGPADEPSEKWPGGHGNLGLAHGITGPLALMSTAMRQDITVSGQAAAIDRIYAELDQWRCGTGERTWWPGMISPAEWKTHAVQQPGPQRPSWCYGTPGLVRASSWPPWHWATRSDSGGPRKP